ncbi:Hypothetical protein BN2458_PEG1773 [Helicobacter typhlonius]|uniref:Damage-inducible protein DinB n=3 Tax=Helicobacter TaxID=209 RepID=A0A0S4PZ46_9HELI|nr:Hypothetical protein BN2458_PEG1773 [Helicobacter typhlonius]
MKYRILKWYNGADFTQKGEKMKKTLLLQAQYNQLANTNMFATFKKCPKEVLYKDCGLYYGSVMQTAEHILCGDIGIVLGAFGAFAPKKLEGVEEIFASVTSKQRLQSAIYEDISAFEALRSKVDSKIIALIESIEDFESIATLSFPGVEFKKSRGFFILALLNHATHHRGQIAAALDILKIENDFNGMLG